MKHELQVKWFVQSQNMASWFQKHQDSSSALKTKNSLVYLAIP